MTLNNFQMIAGNSVVKIFEHPIYEKGCSKVLPLIIMNYLYYYNYNFSGLSAAHKNSYKNIVINQCKSLNSTLNKLPI